MERTILNYVIPLEPVEDHFRANIHTALHEGHCSGAGGYTLGDVAACGKAMAEHSRSVRRKGWQRCGFVKLNDKHCSYTAQSGEKVKELGMKK